MTAYLEPENLMKNLSRPILSCLAGMLLVISFGAGASQPVPRVKHVDLSRYMGRWYVIAAIPTSYGDQAFNMVETYRRMIDGGVCTSLWFHDGGINGPIENIHHPASINAGSGNAEWQVQVFWFIDAQYVVSWLKPDYSQVIAARDDRDYVWLMARTPSISQADYQAMLTRVKAMGYDLSKVRKVPQQWPASGTSTLSFEQSCD